MQRREHEQRNDDGSRPVRNLIQVESEPARKEQDLDRHHGDGAPRNLAEERERDAREDVALGGAATRENLLPRARHMRRVRRVARELERVIRFDRGADVGLATIKKRPAAVGILNAPQIDADLALALDVDFVEIMLEHDVLGRNRRVGLEFEDPVAVGSLPM
jgi:hypothetical protein